MSTKVISFLGTAVRETTYSYQGQLYQGGLFQVALRQFMPAFDEMPVFVTPEAYKEAYPALAALGDDRIRPVHIRRGQTAEGLWQIFEALVAEVNEADTVIFDITHGLRSIPFLTFLAAAYLRSAKQVTIKSVLYGALELGRDGNPAPVIDLTEFVRLLDWLTATNQFVKTGNASALAEELGKAGRPELQPLADTVEAIATGLHLLRPKETSAAAARLAGSLATAAPHLPPPFLLLSDKLLESYGRFGQRDETHNAELVCQLEMINWYHHRGQVVHALSLGREWLVSLLCVQLGLDPEDKNARSEMEFLAGGGKIKDEKTGEVRESEYLTALQALPLSKRLQSLWAGTYQLANLRNDVLHSGFRKKPKPSPELKQAVNEALLELNEIALAWGIRG